MADDPDENVQTVRPQSTDAVVNEEGQRSPDSIADVYNGNKGLDVTRCRARADAEVVLEAR